jgi:hypothetical protein
MRILTTCVLLLAAASAGAQDLPLIRAAGTSLETFEVDLRLDGIDHSSAEGLAKSFARFEEEQHGVRRRFAELVAEAHLGVLRRFYTKDLVDRQAKAYDAVQQKGFRSDVVDVRADGDKATAHVKRTFIVGGREREEATEIELVREGGAWRISVIRDRGRDGKFADRPLGTPPALKAAPVPAPGAPDLSNAKSAAESLRDAMLRFGAQRDNAALSLTDRFFDITAAFFGEAAARKALEDRPTVKSAAPVVLDFSDAMPRLSDLFRVEVTVNEESNGRKNAIGQGAFDYRSEDGEFRVVGEYLRPDPEEPFQAIPANFGLFFLVRR